MKKRSDMKWLLWSAFPMLRIFQLAGDVPEFEKWLKREHGSDLNREILDGYKFFLECAFSGLLGTLASDQELEIKGDLVLDWASAEIFFLGKLPNTCNKTIFLKNIYFHFNPVKKAANSKQFAIAIKHFHQKVGLPFEKVFARHIRIKKHEKLTEEQIYKLFLMEKVYLFFNQINNNGPHAYQGTLLKDWWIPDKKLQRCFIGYKYVVQFVWWKLLGEQEYEKACLKDIHKTDSWKGFVYNEPEPEEKSGDEYLSFILNQTFDIDKQTSFDAFFYRIKEELVEPLEKRHKISFTRMDEFFSTSKKNYNRNVFKNLLLKKNAKEEKRTEEEELDMILYWRPVEIIDSVMHNSIPAFVTMLHGAIGLLKEKEKEWSQAIVCKFVHPKEGERGKNDYSYGILVDAKASAGHYSSGWLIYYDCCGDYSGFSGSEHARAETVIEKYLKKGLLDLRERRIGHTEFRKYISRYVRDKSVHQIKESVEQIEKNMERMEVERRENIIISDAQGLLLELVSYYLISKKSEYSKYTKIDWSNLTAPSGEIDIIMENDNDGHIVECKLSPSTQDMDKEILKVKSKLKELDKKGDKTFEFWFWYEPSEIDKEKIRQAGGKHFSYREKSTRLPDSLKSVLNYKQTPKELPEEEQSTLRNIKFPD